MTAIAAVDDEQRPLASGGHRRRMCGSGVEGKQGREGEGEASEGKRARADEGGEGNGVRGGQQRQATRAGVRRRGGAAA
jgi:hypothetical protein